MSFHELHLVLNSRFGSDVCKIIDTILSSYECQKKKKVSFVKYNMNNMKLGLIFDSQKVL